MLSSMGSSHHKLADGAPSDWPASGSSISPSPFHVFDNSVPSSNCGDYDSAILAMDTLLQYLSVGSSHPHVLTLPGLLWNLQPERAGLTCHRAGLIDVSCKTIPPEEANQDVQILQCWHACAFDDEKWAITMVMYCSWMMYKYYSCLGFFPIKNN